MSDKKFIVRFFIFILVWLVLFFSLIPTLNSDQYQNSSIKISVSIVEPVAMVQISPNEINFGEITGDYATDYKNITVTNIGTLDVQISAILDSNADEIFNYTKFGSSSCSSWTNISKWNSATIHHSSNYSIKNGDSYNFCIKLDLTSYTKTINPKNFSTNLTIWVMPA